MRDDSSGSPAANRTERIAGPPDNGSADGLHQGGDPPRWWTLLVPFPLTLLVAALGLLLGVVAGFSSIAGGGPAGPMPAIGLAELILGVFSIGILIAGLASRAGRRTLRWLQWVTFALACVGLGVSYAWAAVSP